MSHDFKTRLDAKERFTGGELHEIFRAITEIDELVHIGDLGYTVRDRADMSHFEGSSWDHPDVKKFSAAYEILRRRGLVK